MCVSVCLCALWTCTCSANPALAGPIVHQMTACMSESVWINLAFIVFFSGQRSRITSFAEARRFVSGNDFQSIGLNQWNTNRLQISRHLSEAFICSPPARESELNHLLFKNKDSHKKGY